MSHLPISRYKTTSKLKGFISNPGLVLIAFATAFFPRIIEAMGAPSPINFVHFIIVPLLCLVVYLRCRRPSIRQRSIMQSILVGLYTYFAVSGISALINGAGAVNIFLNFMIQAEPFLLMAAIICIPFDAEKLNRFRNWILVFGAIHLALAFGQFIGLETGIIAHQRMTMQDNVQGVFYLSSGGHVVGATVVFLYGIYFFITAKSVSLGWRIAVFSASILEVLISDAKQVILVAVLAWILLIVSRTKNIVVTLRYTIIAALTIYALYWCIYNLDIDYIRSYRTWIRPEIYGPNGDATVQKLYPLRTIPEYYTSILNWFFGLGPGHTVGRIGGWMIRDYGSLLNPLGATRHPVVSSVWNYWNDSYLDSSFFSPFWGWAGVWGDVGFVGLGIYIGLWWLLWTRVCADDLSRFLLLNVLVNGFIFTTMEEPGFMLAVSMLLGLRWHELNPRTQSRTLSSSWDGPNPYLC